MCDYSLHGIENRLAVEGEILVVHRFHTGSKGLTSPDYLEPARKSKSFMAFLATKFVEPSPVCAVCIPDGAKLVMTGIPVSLQTFYGLAATELVTFRQMSVHEAAHRDAVEFRNGVTIRLQELEEGQRVEVRSISSSESALSEETRTFLAI